MLDVTYLLIFNLGDDLDLFASILLKQFAQVEHIGGLANEGSGDKVDLVLAGKVDNIVDILFGKSGQIDHNTGQVHIFAFSNGGIVFNSTRNFSGSFIARVDRQDQGPIGTQNLLSRFDTGGQGFVRAGQLFAVALECIIAGQDQGLSLDQIDLFGIVGKESRSDLGSLGVHQDGNVAILGLGDLAQALQDGQMTGMIAVTEIETSGIHPSVHQFGQSLFAPARGSKGADNFGLSFLDHAWFRDRIEGDVSSLESGDAASVGNHGVVLSID